MPDLVTLYLADDDRWLRSRISGPTLPDKPPVLYVITESGGACGGHASQVATDFGRLRYARGKRNGGATYGGLAPEILERIMGRGADDRPARQILEDDALRDQYPAPDVRRARAQAERNAQHRAELSDRKSA